MSVDFLFCMYICHDKCIDKIKEEEYDGSMDTTIQICTSSKIKKEAMKVFKKEGILMSSAFNAFLEEVGRKGSIPATVYAMEKVPAPVAHSWRK